MYRVHPERGVCVLWQGKDVRRNSLAFVIDNQTKDLFEVRRLGEVWLLLGKAGPESDDPPPVSDLPSGRVVSVPHLRISVAEEDMAMQIEFVRPQSVLQCPRHVRPKTFPAERSLPQFGHAWLVETSSRYDVLCTDNGLWTLDKSVGVFTEGNERAIALKDQPGFERQYEAYDAVATLTADGLRVNGTHKKRLLWRRARGPLMAIGWLPGNQLLVDVGGKSAVATADKRWVAVVDDAFYSTTLTGVCSRIGWCFLPW